MDTRARRIVAITRPPCCWSCSCYLERTLPCKLASESASLDNRGWVLVLGGDVAGLWAGACRRRAWRPCSCARRLPSHCRLQARYAHDARKSICCSDGGMGVRSTAVGQDPAACMLPLCCHRLNQSRLVEAMWQGGAMAIEAETTGCSLPISCSQSSF